MSFHSTDEVLVDRDIPFIDLVREAVSTAGRRFRIGGTVTWEPWS